MSEFELTTKQNCTSYHLDYFYPHILAGRETMYEHHGWVELTWNTSFSITEPLIVDGNKLCTQPAIS